MTRTNISEAYYRVKYRSDESSSPVSEDLKEELIRLRESTRKALEQSWDEMDSLGRQCAISSEKVAQQNGALTKVEEMKKTWQVRCLAAEAKLQTLTQQRERFHYPKRLSLPQSIRRSVTAAINSSKNDPEGAVDASELALKLSSRDKAIASLEYTLDENTKSMNAMKLNMRNFNEKQRIKEENIKKSHALKEKQLKQVIDSLQKELSRTRNVSKNVDLLQNELLKTRGTSKKFDSLHRELFTIDTTSRNETKSCQ